MKFLSKHHFIKDMSDTGESSSDEQEINHSNEDSDSSTIEKQFNDAPTFYSQTKAIPIPPKTIPPPHIEEYEESYQSEYDEEKEIKSNPPDVISSFTIEKDEITKENENLGYETNEEKMNVSKISRENEQGETKYITEPIELPDQSNLNIDKNEQNNDELESKEIQMENNTESYSDNNKLKKNMMNSNSAGNFVFNDISMNFKTQVVTSDISQNHNRNTNKFRKNHNINRSNTTSCENTDLSSFRDSSKPLTQIPKANERRVSDFLIQNTSLFSSESILASSQTSGSFIHNNNIQEERSQWLHQILIENPHFLAMRERTLPLSYGLSFANVTHTKTVSALAAINRRTILEMISQHLQAIGLYQTAEILMKESGHPFQNSSQPWDRTDLHLLVSMALSNYNNNSNINVSPSLNEMNDCNIENENANSVYKYAWNIPPDMSHQYIIESLEEDFFSSPYREDPMAIWDEFFDPDLNVIYENGQPKTYQNILAASLKRLIVYHVTSDVQMIPDEEQHMFFLTIHSITSADHFLRHLVTLFDCELQNTMYEDKIIENSKLFSIRKNIINLIQKWTKFHGLFIGKRTLKSVNQFCTRIIESKEFEQLHKFIQVILNILPNLRYGMRLGSQELTNRAPPIIKNEHILFHPRLTILDPEPQEVARQITLIYHEKYASIHSLEFITAISNRHTTIQTPTLSEFFKFGDHLSHLVAETYIKAENKQSAFSRLFEISQALFQLNNYEALSCFIHFLNRDDIFAIGKGAESQKVRIKAMWRETGEDDKFEKLHPTVYENSINKIFNEWGSAIPNMHAELKRGNKKLRSKVDFINGLINWEKVREISQRCTVLYRFQNQSYNLWNIPQITKAVTRPLTMTVNDIDEKIDELYKLI
ncbi:hypothetical protein TRFO_28045 [Tritrichomonas foetus]|uniref:Ras-GEF domain-containing protein n=1 Tax=Tritrichomonas foetus TaxID=1144522 RepID=A0A1J4K0J6_9EUKA|nr:hypothetical protein TRFO_28045 [Tritrichomonas foetus]|eukprot:OHT04482.1 hypothetical protein TRFO_28045 [Tritrichomonas foetus]